MTVNNSTWKMAGLGDFYDVVGSKWVRLKSFLRRIVESWSLWWLRNLKLGVFLLICFLFYAYFVHEPIHYVTAISFGYNARIEWGVIPYVILPDPSGILPPHYISIALAPYLFGLVSMLVLRLLSIVFGASRKIIAFIACILFADFAFNILLMPFALFALGFGDFSNILVLATSMGLGGLALATLFELGLSVLFATVFFRGFWTDVKISMRGKNE